MLQFRMTCCCLQRGTSKHIPTFKVCFRGCGLRFGHGSQSVPGLRFKRDSCPSRTVAGSEAAMTSTTPLRPGAASSIGPGTPSPTAAHKMPSKRMSLDEIVNYVLQTDSDKVPRRLRRPEGCRASTQAPGRLHAAGEREVGKAVAEEARTGWTPKGPTGNR